MNKLDKTLADVPGMPMSQTNWSIFQAGTNRFIDEQRAYDAEEQRQLYDVSSAKFTEAQKGVFQSIATSVEEKQGHIFFLAAAGGCGKTFVSNTLTHYFRGREKIVLCVASSGIASLLLIGGRTVHS
jgi:RecG-like helicase